MSDLIKSDQLNPATDDAVPSEVQDSASHKIDLSPKLPELTVSLGLRDAVKLAVTNPPERENTDMPKITAEDKIGTPIDLEKALVDLKEVFEGRRVIEVEEIINNDGNLKKVKIEFSSNGTKIFWKGLARIREGEWKLIVHPLVGDDPRWETVDENFLELGMVRAILRHRLEKLSKHD